MQNDKSHKISCDVDSCVFNHDSHHCTADRIQVCCTCAEPDCCDETICRTFRPREN